ncbi:MAG: TIGR01621 family pseudouridine synthase [Kangiellaceae bacterium]|nr:TIGR01621 family pseudouridine synthase [Kangiellaceae bacterium]
MSKLTIVFDHPDFIIIDKPTEISFHTENNQAGIVEVAKQQTGDKLWPVHRLDKITSGLLILAKSTEAAAEFGKLFENQQISKTYIALSDKKPKKKMGKIIGDMDKSRSGSWKLNKTTSNPAITQFQSLSLIPGIRLFLVKPKTGKTHQIRVALKAVGAPILGDTRYSGTPSDRGYLHALQLSFRWKDKAVKICSFPIEGDYFKLAELKRLVDKHL